MDFTSIDYLKTGNQRQQNAYLQLMDLGVFHDLAEFQPVLTGTIPLGIDVPSSDLDIVCCCQHHAQFQKQVTSLYQQYSGFHVKSSYKKGEETTVVSFQFRDFEIELFAQNQISTQQPAYLHMLVEYKILQAHPESFKQQVIQLKQSGFKTEPAFAHLLGLKGDPYQALLSYRLDM